MGKTTGTGSGAGDLTRLVPGFDFLQGLMKAGGAGLPGIGQWIAPTLDPAELQKRIDELRTVQFWLEQNARLLGTTIQALEVQRMTVATLRGMNLPLADLADALKVGSMQLGPAEAARAGTAPKAASAPSGTGTASAAASSRAQPKASAGGNGRSGGGAAVDPMQWWGSLTQQFTELAAKAMKEGSAEMARMNAARDAAGASPSSDASASPGTSAASSGSGGSGGSGTPAAAAPKQPTLAEAAATSIERAMAASTQFAGAAAKASAALAGAAMPAAAKPSPKAAPSVPKASSASSPPAPSKTATAPRRRARKSA
ncbi:MAG: PhaM family polyhydroxyalkanoate granule multifunctional regulatory protein [Rubrivivax sp.]